jgi:glucose/arabinose dehydrogenase
VYVANTGSVIRFPYRNGDTRARAKAETVVASLSGGGRLEGGGHWTRDVVFSNDGATMFVSVGSKSNVADDAAEARRARIFAYTPEGKNERVYAYGIRNPVGLAIHPTTGKLWTSVNERDELGNDLVPDYMTSVRQGEFFGWPYSYFGPNVDERVQPQRPELVAAARVPDYALGAHTSSLGLAFYDGTRFPQRFHGGAFVGQHGSWNRKPPSGYRVVFVPFAGGRPSGDLEPVITGFLDDEGQARGRPVGVAVAADGALLVADDVGNIIWRMTPALR